MKYSPTYSLKWHFASSFGSCLDDINGIQTAAMLVMGFCEKGGQKQGASCLSTAFTAVEINENLDSTGDYPEGRPQLNKPSGRYSD